MFIEPWCINLSINLLHILHWTCSVNACSTSRPQRAAKIILQIRPNHSTCHSLHKSSKKPKAADSLIGYLTNHDSEFKSTVTQINKFPFLNAYKLLLHRSQIQLHRAVQKPRSKFPQPLKPSALPCKAWDRGSHFPDVLHLPLRRLARVCREERDPRHCRCVGGLGRADVQIMIIACRRCFSDLRHCGASSSWWNSNVNVGLGQQVEVCRILVTQLTSTSDFEVILGGLH